MHKHVDSYHATKLSSNLGRMQRLTENPHDRLSSNAFGFFLIYSYIQCVNQHHMISAHCVQNVCICVHVLMKKSAVCHRIIQISLESGEGFTSRGQMRGKKQNNNTFWPPVSVFWVSRSWTVGNSSFTDGNFLKSSRDVIIYSFISHWPFIDPWMFEIFSLTHHTSILKSCKMFQK